MDRLKLYGNCIIVKGHNRSSICDLQRNEVKLIPNDLYHLLLTNEGKTVSEIKNQYNNQYDEVIDDYIDFLIKNEFAFLTETPELFPKLNPEWHYPFPFTNAVIDYDATSKYSIDAVINQLDNLNCKNLQFRFFHDVDIATIIHINEWLQNKESFLSSISFVIKNSAEINIDKLTNCLQSYPRISSFILYNALEELFLMPFDEDNTRYIISIKNNIPNSSFCGVISTKNFVPNIKAYTEGLHHNSCLNRKIAIDTQGNIKNCPSMAQSFGNIQNTTLEEALNHPEFKKYWNITKDQIEVCKDCEFRYICTDCRAYLENPEDMYSKPLKCGYNPYTNEWEEWSANPLKQKAIEYYNLKNSPNNN